MKDVCWRLPLFLLLAVAMVMIPLTQTAQARPGLPPSITATPNDCYQTECHTLGAAEAAPAGKGVQDALYDIVTDDVFGMFEMDRTTPTPHALGTVEWATEGRCVGCHTDKQAELTDISGPMSNHPIYNRVFKEAPDVYNHVRCIDCHTAGNLDTDTYHVADADDWLGGTLDCAGCHNGTFTLLPHIPRSPVTAHGTARYDTGTWTSCYDPDRIAAYTGCHDGHSDETNSGLINNTYVTDYETADITPGVCEKCHTAQDVAGYASDNKHDLNKATHAECDVCHDYSTHTGGTLFMEDLSGGASTDAATALDAFCEQCHDGGYEGGFAGWQGGLVGGDPALVDIDGDGATWGYEFTGHGLDSPNRFSPAAWKTTAANGNQSPVDAMAANFADDVSCDACHNSHGNTNWSMILTTINGNAVDMSAPESSNWLIACMACHNEVDDIDLNQGNSFADIDLGTFQASQHWSSSPPEGMVGCYDCHNPHGTQYTAMMIPGDEEAGCTAQADCHGDVTPVGSAYSKSLTAGTGEFGPAGASASIHNVDANGLGGLEIECTNCHNPHIATAANPMVDPDSIATAMPDAGAYIGAPVTNDNFDRVTDFCRACHDGALPPANYGVQGAAAVHTHWSPNGGAGPNGQLIYPPSDGPFVTQCWHCHDSHGAQNIHLVGNTRDTDPFNLGTVWGANPTLLASRAIYNPIAPVWSTASLTYAAATALDPTNIGDLDGDNPATGDGVCDRCHDDTAAHLDKNNLTHIFPNSDCTTCHSHNGSFEYNLITYYWAFPTLSPDDCYACHSASSTNNFKTEAQFGGIDAAYSNNDAGGTLANGTWHSINYSADAGNDCYDCHLLDDIGDANDHKNGTVILQVNPAGTKYYSASGDYQVAIADSIAFCLECHGGTPPAGDNFDNCDNTNTPVVSADTAGTKYTANGHGSAASLSALRAGPPALGCTTCHQYHGGSLAQDSGDPTIGGTMTVIDVTNEDMLERFVANSVNYDYLQDNATAKDNYCADTCHNPDYSVLIDNASYTAGTAKVFDHTYEVGDGEAKDQTGCPQSAAPWNDCDTHPTNAPIPNAAPKLGHFNQAPNLPLAAYDYSDDQPVPLDWTGNTGNIICTSCHEPHALTNSDTATWNKTDLQMLKDNWSDTGGSNTGALCSDVTNYCHK